MSFLPLVFSFVLILLVVPLILFLERRLLGVIQLRLGVFLYLANGLFVFLADFLKILSKHAILVFTYNRLLLLFFAFLFLFHAVSVFLALLYGLVSGLVVLPVYVLMVVLCHLAFIPFHFLHVMFVSNSVYAYIGLIRYVYVLVACELVLSFVFFCFCLLVANGLWYSLSYYTLVLVFALVFQYVLFVIADTGRLPFDLSEAESELVSGYSTELFAFTFLFCFFSEYVLLLSFCLLLAYFTGCSFLVFLVLVLSVRALALRLHWFYLLRFSWLYHLWVLNVLFCYLMVATN